MIKGMDIDTARRYIKVMKEIQKIVDKIHALADMMGMIYETEEKGIEIKPATIGYFGKTIAIDVLRIIEQLDEHFVSSTEVMLELEALQNDNT